MQIELRDLMTDKRLADISVGAKSEHAGTRPGNEHLHAYFLDCGPDLCRAANAAHHAPANSRRLSDRKRVQSHDRPRSPADWTWRGTPSTALLRKCTEASRVETVNQPNGIADRLVEVLDTHKCSFDSLGRRDRQQCLHTRKRGILSSMKPKESGWELAWLTGGFV
jgi:hypothetical protein